VEASRLILFIAGIAIATSTFEAAAAQIFVHLRIARPLSESERYHIAWCNDLPDEESADFLGSAIAFANTPSDFRADSRKIYILINAGGYITEILSHPDNEIFLRNRGNGLLVARLNDVRRDHLKRGTRLLPRALYSKLQTSDDHSERPPRC